MIFTFLLLLTSSTWAAWFHQIDPYVWIDDVSSLSDVARNATDDELAMLLSPLPLNDSLLDGGLYVTVNGERKRTLYSNQFEIDCHLLTNQGKWFSMSLTTRFCAPIGCSTKMPPQSARRVVWRHCMPMRN